VTPNDSGLSKSQLDRIGSRLRGSDDPTDEDLTLLNRYRERFVDVTRSVVDVLREISSYPIETRHKSIPSIVAKLRRRQPARLSAIQDMAGARIVVPNVDAQNELIELICSRFPDASLDDKRLRPTFGYRAVHVVVNVPLPFEIQLRTDLEHAWAQLSERLADRYGFELKYGGGPESVRLALLEYADFAAAIERLAAGVRRGKATEESLKSARSYFDRLPEIVETLRIE
jgi:putative GTP pyrophosphokinase